MSDHGWFPTGFGGKGKGKGKGSDNGKGKGASLASHCLAHNTAGTVKELLS